MADTKWLQKRDRGWYAVQDVPRPLQAILSKRRFIASLHTREHHIALARRHAALAAFQAEITAARKDATGSAALPIGLAWRDTLTRLQRGDPAIVASFGGRPMQGHGPGGEVIEMSAEEAALDLAEALLSDQAAAVAETEGTTAAETLLALAYGRATPLLLHVDDWLAEGGVKGPLKPRTRFQYRADVVKLEDWTKAARAAPTVEAFTKKTAGRYVTEEIVTLDPGTANRRISALSSYWRWMVKRGVAEANPWSGQGVSKAAHDGSGERNKRPFSEAEMVALLSGDASPELADAMRVLALSGLRLEEVYRLTVADCGSGWFNVRTSKTRAGIRRVPIHSDLAAIIAQRTQGKAPTAFLFHEPGPATPGRERSATVSQRFGRYRQRVGVHDAREGRRHSAVDAHSFRRWFITEARNAGQDAGMVAAIAGHKAGNLADDVYSSGPSDALRRAVVEAVRLPVLAQDA